MLTYIGSKNTASSDDMNIVTSKFIEEINLLSNDAKCLFEYHNMYTSYVTLLLFAATGHRPVIDPFCYYKDFNLSEGHLLIDDKAISEKHRYRLTVLSPLAIKQVGEYIKHLKWMTIKLKDYDIAGSINNAIINTLDTSLKRSEQNLPFLFFLEKKNGKIKTQSVSESNMNSLINNIWPFEYNISRHFISTILRNTIYSGATLENVITIRDIESHLGHMEQQSHPYGKYATKSFFDHKKDIQPHLDELLNQQGWRIIKSKGNRPAKLIDAPLWHHSTEEFGPASREKGRITKRKDDVSEVKSALREHSEKDIKNQDVVNQVRDSIIKNSNGKLEDINRRLSLLWKFLSLEYKKDKEVKLPRNYIPFIPEASPFNKDTVSRYKDSKVIKESFLSYMADKGRGYKSDKNKHNTDNYLRLAELVTSAAIFDGVENLHNLELILQSSFIPTHENGMSFIDLNDEEGNLKFRWFPQEISLSIMYSFLSKGTDYKLPNPIRKPNILSHISKLLSEITSTKIKDEDCLKFLSTSATNFSLLNTPGYLHNIITGKTYQQPVPLNTIIRMQRNEKIVISDNEINNNDRNDRNELNNDISKILIRNNMSNTYQGAHDFITGIENDIQEASDTKIEKGKNPDNIKKLKLAELLKKRINGEILGEGNKKYPSIAKLLAAWSIKLCRHGTDLYTGPIVFNTVVEYTRLVTKAVIYQLCKCEYLDLGTDEYEYIYEVAIENNKHKDKTKFRNNLEDFHNYLVLTKVADPIDWQPFIDDVNSSRVKSKVDANYITYNEYINALEIIYTLSKNSTDLREYYTKYCGILICGYRFGLRISEATQIEFHNLQFDNDFNELIIHITNNRHKNTKSIAGRRQIPLIEKLSGTEKRILKTLFSSNEQFENRSHEIFSDHNQPDELLDISKANKIIKMALIAVTGDKKIRFHHLRHTYANRLYMLLFNDTNNFNYDFNKLTNPSDNNSAKILRSKLSSNNEVNNRLLKAISSIMGHSSVTTTLYNYIHISDYHYYSWLQTHAYINKYNNKKNTDFITSYIFCKPHSSTRQSRLRRKGNNITTEDLKASLKNLIDFKIFTKSEVETAEYIHDIKLIEEAAQEPSTPTLLDIDSTILLSTPSLHIDNNTIANRLHHDKQVIDSIIEEFKSSKHKSMYAGYHPDKEDKNKSITFHKETNRLRAYLSKIAPKINNLTNKEISKLRKGLEVWESHFFSKQYQYGIVLNSTESISLYLDALTTLNISIDELSATYPTNITNPVLYEVKKHLNYLLTIRNGDKKYEFKKCISSDNVRKISPKETARTIERISITLNSKSKSKSKLSYQRTLDRLLFVLSIYIKSKSSLH